MPAIKRPPRILILLQGILRGLTEVHPTARARLIPGAGLYVSGGNWMIHNIG